MESCLTCGRRIPFSFSWEALLRLAPFRRDVLFPVHHWLCPDCREQLEWIETGCLRCSKPLEEIPPHLREPTSQGVLCYDCQRWLQWEQDVFGEPLLKSNVSLIRYNTFAQEVFTQYKFRGDERLKYFLASLAVFGPEQASRGRVGTEEGKMGPKTYFQSLGEQAIREADLVAPIPLSPQRLQERGFNQADRIAQLLARHYQKPYIPNLLVLKDDESKQSKRGRPERLARLFDRFLNNEGHRSDIINKRILLVDDIYTTGATMHAAAWILRRDGARSVTGYTIAR